MCTYPGTKHGVEDPRQEPRLLGWEYEDCCALRREDVAGVAALRGEARCSDRPRASRQHPGWQRADSVLDGYRRGEGISVDRWSMNGDYGGFGKEDIQYTDCRRADGAWEGKSQDTEGRNYRVCEREGVQYRDCSSEIREGWYREDRVPEQYREGGRQYGEDRGPGEYKEGGRWYQEDRARRDYREDERRYGEKERRYRQERDTEEYREGRRQYREGGGNQVYREGEKWYREDGGSGAYRQQERLYVGVRDQVDQEDVKRHRQPKGHIMDHSSLDRGCEAPAFAVRSSGDSNVSLGSGTCYTQSKTWDVDYDGHGELEGAAPGPGMPARSSGRAERSRVRTGRPDWSQVWELEAEEENRAGSVLQRNSFYRRTAPSALRHSEFVRTRKEKRGTQGNAGQLLSVCLHPALAPGQHWDSGIGGWPAQTGSRGKPWSLLKWASSSLPLCTVTYMSCKGSCPHFAETRVGGKPRWHRPMAHCCPFSCFSICVLSVLGTP